MTISDLIELAKKEKAALKRMDSRFVKQNSYLEMIIIKAERIIKNTSQNDGYLNDIEQYIKDLMRYGVNLRPSAKEGVKETDQKKEKSSVLPA